MHPVVMGDVRFVCGHLVDAFLQHGHQVSPLENLDALARSSIQPVSNLNPGGELVLQDMRYIDGMQLLLSAVEAAYYLAGAVGVSDSMYLSPSVLESAGVPSSVADSEIRQRGLPR